MYSSEDKRDSLCDLHDQNVWILLDCLYRHKIYLYYLLNVIIKHKDSNKNK